MRSASAIRSTRTCAAIFLAIFVASAVAQDQSETKPPPATKQEQMKKEVDEAVESIRAYSIEQRNVALRSAQKAQNQIDRGIGELQRNINARRGKMAASVQHRADATMTDLRKRRKDLSSWYDRMHHDSEQAWSDVKNGFVDSYHGVSEALRKARAEFDQESSQKDSDK